MRPSDGVFESLFRKKGPVKKGCGVQALFLMALLALTAALAALFQARWGSWTAWKVM
jgi:hypothetical protein